MRIPTVLAVLTAWSTACAGLRKPVPALPPLAHDEAEVHVYLLPPAGGAERLSFTLAAVSMRRADGGVVPLVPLDVEVPGTGDGRQREVAWGRVRAGDYAGFDLQVASARTSAAADGARLIVEPDPAPVDLEVRLEPGRAAVIWLALAPDPIRNDFAFAPRFAATVPALAIPPAALYATSAPGARVAVVDRSARAVTAVVPLQGPAGGIAVGVDASRGYVALPAQDEVEVIDLRAGTSVARVRLSPGDGPAEVAVAADGTLVVVNERSRTVAFLSPSSLAELARVPVGDAPVSLVLERSRRRAYVVNRGSATVTVIDTGNRAVVGTVATEPEPLGVALSRDGSRLYVVHAGSSRLASFAVPSLAPGVRAYVGLGATAIEVDPRNDLLYLSRGDERRIAVIEPVTLQPLDEIDLPAAASRLAVWGAESTLFAVMPERATVAVVDLTARRVVGEIPVGPAPYGLALAGEGP